MKKIPEVPLHRSRYFNHFNSKMSIQIFNVITAYTMLSRGLSCDRYILINTACQLSIGVHTCMCQLSSKSLAMLTESDRAARLYALNADYSHYDKCN